jgi:hypothetical protein
MLKVGIIQLPVYSRIERLHRRPVIDMEFKYLSNKLWVRIVE